MEGGYIIDWHACDLFPKSWIDLVIVLRVDSATLYDRLTERYLHSPLGDIWIANIKREYGEAKLQENIDSEIMEVLLDEAREAFDAEIVVELTSNTSDEMESNVERIEAWVKQWKKDHKVDS
jgi:adenylate kinase